MLPLSHIAAVCSSSRPFSRTNRKASATKQLQFKNSCHKNEKEANQELETKHSIYENKFLKTNINTIIDDKFVLYGSKSSLKNLLRNGLAKKHSFLSSEWKLSHSSGYSFNDNKTGKSTYFFILKYLAID